MRSGFRIVALAAVLPLCAGCNLVHRKAAPPPQAQAPSIPPEQMAALIPLMPPPFPPAADPTVKLDTAILPGPKAEAAPPRRLKVPRRRVKPAPQESAQQQPEKVPVQTAPPNPQIASAQPSEASPIGQLSTANDNANTADRRAIANLIDSTETALNNIKKNLSSDEQKTATQIRTFITRARDALKADDLDGARTLSTKAHLLLQELVRQ